MHFSLRQSGNRQPPCRQAAFTLVEVVMSVLILALVMAGLVYGYVQANWNAEWTSMALAAQGYASAGAEQVRAADWRPRDYPAYDELGYGYTQTRSGYLDVPGASASYLYVTNVVTVTDVYTNPPVKQIRSDCYWTFVKNNRQYTNTVILWRTSDQ